MPYWDKQYSAITVLRLLMCQQEEENNNPELISQGIWMLDKLLDHNYDRKKEQPKIWDFEKEFIIDFILKVRLKR